MACKSFWECLLKVLNFLLILVGLAMIGYGVYLFVEYKNDVATGSDSPTASPSMEFVQLGRPLLLMVSVADSLFDNLPKAWLLLITKYRRLPVVDGEGKLVVSGCGSGIGNDIGCDYDINRPKKVVMFDNVDQHQVAMQ